MQPTLIVIPTFNEAATLPTLVAQVKRELPGCAVLVVDDASSDGTGAIAEQLARSDANVHVLHRSGKLGLGSAYVEGFRWGMSRGFERFVEMDADLSHDPAYLPSFMAALDADADVVVGSRNVPGGAVEGWGPIRHVISKGGSLYARLALGLDVRDLTTGYKAYTRHALERISIDRLKSNGYAFQIETTFRASACGLRVVELPIVFVDRRVGRSKMTWRDIAEAMTGVLAMRRRRLG